MPREKRGSYTKKVYIRAPSKGNNLVLRSQKPYAKKLATFGMANHQNKGNGNEQINYNTIYV